MCGVIGDLILPLCLPILYCHYYYCSFIGVELADEIPTNNPPTLSSSDTVAQVLIAANDGTRGQLEFPANYRLLNISENTSTVEIVVQRTFGTYGTVSVFIYSQTSRNAILDTDYKFEPHQIIFLAGESEKIVNVTIINDSIPEAEETFELVLASPQGGATLSAFYIAQIIIAENDGAGGVIQFSTNESITVQEAFTSDGLPTSVDVLITRGPGLFGVISVEFTIVDENGTLTTDISPANGTIIFGDLQASSVLKLSAVDDELPEFDERFTIKLSCGFSFLLGDFIERTITVIASDYPNGLLSISSASNTSGMSVEEADDTTITCQVLRHGGLSGNISVTVHVSPGSASAVPGSQLVLATLQKFNLSADGYCSNGDYLLAIKARNRAAWLYYWDGNYRHTEAITVSDAIECFMYFNNGITNFVIISQGVLSASAEVHQYSVSNTHSAVQTTSVTTNKILHSSFDSQSKQLAVLTVNSGERILERFNLMSGLEKIGVGVSAVTAVSIAAAGGLVFVADSQSVKSYNTHTLTMNETIPAADTYLISAIEHDRNLILLAVSHGSLFITQREGKSATQPYTGLVTSAHGFILNSQTVFLLTTDANSTIIHWDGSDIAVLWSSNISTSLIPLTPASQTLDPVIFGRTGEHSSLLIGEMLNENADYIPRYLDRSNS